MPRPLITADIRAAVDASFRQMLAVGGIRTDIFEYSLTDFLNHGTVQPAMVYVETTGSDTNGDGSVDRPYATVQKALEAGRGIQHLLKIKVGIGDFPGFSIDGFTMIPYTASVPVGVNILGSRITPTLASGTVTGTLTATTAGSLTPATWTVLTDSSQNWVVNALKGMMVELANGSIEVIYSNTATTMTIETTSAFGAIGNTYTLRKNGTRITTPVNVPAVLPLAHGTAAAAGTAGIAIYNNLIGPSQWLRIEGFEIDCAASNAILCTGNLGTVRIDRCSITGATPTAGLNCGGPGSILGVSNVFDLRNVSAAAIVVNQNFTNVTMSKGLITNLGGGNTNNGVLIQVSGAQVAISGHMDHHVFGIKVTASFGTMLNLSGLSIDTGNNSQGILCSGSGHAGFAGLVLSMTGCEIKNCGAA
jgi:hypothetical protein